MALQTAAPRGFRGSLTTIDDERGLRITDYPASDYAASLLTTLGRASLLRRPASPDVATEFLVNIQLMGTF